MWALDTPIRQILEEGRDLVAAAGDAPDGCAWVAAGLASLTGSREKLDLQGFLEQADAVPRPNARKIMLQGLIFPYTVQMFTRPALLFTAEEVAKDTVAASYLLALFGDSLPAVQRAAANAKPGLVRALKRASEVTEKRRTF